MKKSQPTIVKGVTTIEGRIFASTKPINPTAINARDQRHYTGNQVSLTALADKFLMQPPERFPNTV